MRLFNFMYGKMYDFLWLLGNKSSTSVAAAFMLGSTLSFWFYILAGSISHFLNYTINKSNAFPVFIIGVIIMFCPPIYYLNNNRYIACITPKKQRQGFGYYLGATVGLIWLISVLSFAFLVDSIWQ